MNHNVFQVVESELARWQDAGFTPKLWLRDDDATRPTAALEHLLTITGDLEMPLLLAVIPKMAGSALAERLAELPLVTPAVHGYAHSNHAPAGEKSVELIDTPAREAGAVLAELRAGIDKLDRLFGARLSTILVPPWNRVSPSVALRIPDLGFSAISVFGWTRTSAPLPHVNTHVDVMNWRGGRVGHDLETICGVLAARFGEARLRGGVPIGLLTHHLAHDTTAWSGLGAILEWIRLDGRITVCDAETAMQAGAQA